jgi:DNA-directed RNA polymerase specialized sigma24 family protein
MQMLATRLTPEQVTVVALRYGQGLRYTQIVEQTGFPLWMVKQCLSDLKKFRAWAEKVSTFRPLRVL